MNVLVLNCGSSTLKFRVIKPRATMAPGKRDRCAARGLIDPIGRKAECRFVADDGVEWRETLLIRDHEEAVRKALGWLSSQGGRGSFAFQAVGHRVVHGGDLFPTSVRIDTGVMEALQDLNELAPLHNPTCLAGIKAARSVLGPSIPMVAVFDTSFHQTLPEHASLYAIPYAMSARHRIRRYGFHGIAHRSMMVRYAELVRKQPEEVTIITLQLGNGCSATAIRRGISVDTSMGFTPLEGLVMGTRSGDLDPALVGYLARKEGVPVAEVDRWLNESSGLLGLSGRSGDMREIIKRAPNDGQANLAIEIFCYRVLKYLGAYLAVLGGAEAVIFSGGIGENSPVVRSKICNGLDWCGLVLDPDLNSSMVGVEGRISAPGSKTQAYVIPADEEALIARDTANLLQRGPYAA